MSGLKLNYFTGFIIIHELVNQFQYIPPSINPWIIHYLFEPFIYSNLQIYSFSKPVNHAFYLYIYLSLDLSIFSSYLSISESIYLSKGISNHLINYNCKTLSVYMYIVYMYNIICIYIVYINIYVYCLLNCLSNDNDLSLNKCSVLFI